MSQYEITVEIKINECEGSVDRRWSKPMVPYIPCYAVRQTLGLRNSSNRGEKANDLVVSERQKHNGMSWSPTGSVALAAVTALVRNQGQDTWFHQKTVPMEFPRAA